MKTTIKYTIENKETGSILCKSKSGRRFRQSIDSIATGLSVIVTTKGRAESEKEYLNANYQKGWEIYEVTEVKR